LRFFPATATGGRNAPPGAAPAVKVTFALELKAPLLTVNWNVYKPAISGVKEALAALAPTILALVTKLPPGALASIQV
jgi:hypothetical protein